MVKGKHNFDTNPFGLKDQAEVWLVDELQNEDYYHPLHVEAHHEGMIPEDHFPRVFKEYHRRSELDHEKGSPLVVLAGIGFGRECLLTDAIMPTARYLFFPKLGAAGQSALFMIYIPGHEHGVIRTDFFGQVSCDWIRKNEEFKKRLCTCLSAGGDTGFHPDIRVYPKHRYISSDGDVDATNWNHPYSRFLVEIEYKNRDPVEVRQRGYLYMRPPDDDDKVKDPPYVQSDDDDEANDNANADDGPKFVRMFLACLLFRDYETLDTSDLHDLDYEAALVLWKRDDTNDDIKVHSAIDFGTIPLSEENRRKYEVDTPERLIAVGRNEWTRLEKNGQERRMGIPKEGFLYRVSQSDDDNVTSNANSQQQHFLTQGIGDFILDIDEIAEGFENELSHKIWCLKRKAKRIRIK